MKVSVLVLVVLAWLTAACAASTADASRTLTVFAAASLTDAFEAAGAAFEAEHPDLTVSFGFAGSQRLAGHLLDGAAADVFAPADRTHLERLTAAGIDVGDVTVFATGTLAIAVGAGNPHRIDGLDDLSSGELVVVLPAEAVPAGAYARRVLDRAGIVVRAASLETDVRGVLSKVRLGEADAGIVYASDLLAAGDAVTGVDIPAEVNVEVAYQAAVLEAAPNRADAQSFVDFLLGERGQAVLRAHGFEAP